MMCAAGRFNSACLFVKLFSRHEQQLYLLINMYICIKIYKFVKIQCTLHITLMCSYKFLHSCTLPSAFFYSCATFSAALSVFSLWQRGNRNDASWAIAIATNAWKSVQLYFELQLRLLPCYYSMHCVTLWRFESNRANCQVKCGCRWRPTKSQPIENCVRDICTYVCTYMMKFKQMILAVIVLESNQRNQILY